MASDISRLAEIFPSINSEDLRLTLVESQGDVILAIHRISEGHFQQWSEQGKKAPKGGKKLLIAERHGFEATSSTLTASAKRQPVKPKRPKHSLQSGQAIKHEITRQPESLTENIRVNLESTPLDTSTIIINASRTIEESDEPKQNYQAKCVIDEEKPKDDCHTIDEVCHTYPSLASHLPVIMPAAPSSKFRNGNSDSTVATVVLPRKITMRNKDTEPFHRLTAPGSGLAFSHFIDNYPPTSFPEAESFEEASRGRCTIQPYDYLASNNMYDESHHPHQQYQHHPVMDENPLWRNNYHQNHPGQISSMISGRKSFYKSTSTTKSLIETPAERYRNEDSAGNHHHPHHHQILEKNHNVAPFGGEPSPFTRYRWNSSSNFQQRLNEILPSCFH